VALATLFTRAARRAGVALCLTDGFSPHAKISFGPELPAGVVALGEPVDLWLKEQKEREEQENEKADWTSDDLAFRLNEQMPEGFCVKQCLFPAEGAPALGKECGAAHYLIWERGSCSAEDLLAHLKNHFGGEVLFAAIDSRVSIVLANPAKNGIGGWVKTLVPTPAPSEVGSVSAWKDLCIVRTALGRWDGVRMKTLAEEGAVWD
jgi:hypothetical protein